MKEIHELEKYPSMQNPGVAQMDEEIREYREQIEKLRSPFFDILRHAFVLPKFTMAVRAVTRRQHHLRGFAGIGQDLA